MTLSLAKRFYKLHNDHKLRFAEKNVTVSSTLELCSKSQGGLPKSREEPTRRYVRSIQSKIICSAWKFKQHMKQASASAKVKSSYALGLNRLVSSGEISDIAAEKWASIDKRLLALHRDTKELLWHSRRRISRDYASSEDGLGKYPKNDS